MNQEEFRKHYERLSDEELGTIFADKKHLVPDAVSALDREVQRRGTKPAKPVTRIRKPGSDEHVKCLEDYSEYQAICRKARFWGKYGYVIAVLPFVLLLALGRVLGTHWLDDSTFLAISTFVWGMLVAVYALSVFFRRLGFNCPQCGRGFGRGDECFNCGVPRSRKKTA